MRTVIRDVGTSAGWRGGGENAALPGARGKSARLASRVAFALVLLTGMLAPSAASAADDCSNAEIRAVQGVDLPDCRAYEMVSPADKPAAYQAIAFRGTLSEDGNRVPIHTVYLEQDEPDSLTAPITLYHAERDPVDGWKHRALNPPLGYTWGGQGTFDIDPAVTRYLYWTQSISQYERSEGQLFFRGADKSWTPASPLIKPLSGLIGSNYNFAYNGGSSDLSHVVVRRPAGAATRMLPDDPAPATGSTAYGQAWELVDVGTLDARLRAIDRASNDPVTDEPGARIAGGCGILVGAVNGPSGQQASGSHAISDDGSMIYFTARPGSVTTCTPAAAPARIFARHMGRTTVQVSQSQCARVDPAPACTTAPAADDRFEAASADGRRVFFTTVRQLTDSDTDATRDLYVYDFNPPAGKPRLVQVSFGDGEDGSTNGAGASVSGVVRFSDDGSRAYFVATGNLTSVPNARGQVAAPGSNNLYVWQRDGQNPDGRVAFIATLPAGDSSLWAVLDRSRPAQVAPKLGTDLAGRSVGGDGRTLVFSSTGALTADAPGGALDIFRYDDSSSPGTLELVSRRAPGSPGAATDAATVIRPDETLVSWAAAENMQRALTEDGELIVFQTNRALVPEDTNGLSDVYQWRAGPDGGTVSLLSSGAQAEGAYNPSVTPDGRTILVVTEQQLVAEDIDDALDTYSVRTGGGFFPPPPEPVKPVCVDDECQDAPSTPPTPVEPGTGGLQDPGTVPVRAKLTVGSVPPAARRAFARTGRLRLSVGVSTPGTVTATASARLRRPGSRGTVRRQVGRVHVRVTKAGLVRPVLRLSPSARRQLGSRGRLAVTVSVRFSKVSASKTVRLVLTTTKGKA
jgi:hypothetical protein